MTMSPLEPLDAGLYREIVRRALAEDFGGRVEAMDWDGCEEGLRDAALVVQTTSLGMSGQPPLPVRADALGPDALVCDIVYAPRRTAFLEDAASRGNPVVEGLGMLLHQARAAFAAWFSGDATPRARLSN